MEKCSSYSERLIGNYVAYQMVAVPMTSSHCIIYIVDLFKSDFLSSCAVVAKILTDSMSLGLSALAEFLIKFYYCCICKLHRVVMLDGVCR